MATNGLITEECPDEKSGLFIVQWLLDECDEDHRNIDPRSLDRDELIHIVASALEAWEGGAR